MTPIQQLYLGLGVKKKTYMDDVFSTYLYQGADSSNRDINNGIDLAGQGGMVWVRPRNNTIGINVFDTVRGATKRLFASDDYSEAANTSTLNQFNSNGFRVNGNYSTNGPSSYNYASWTFRKAPGFFDVVTYTGNGSDRTIAHSLGSIPGFYMIKRLDTNSDWVCFHREFITGNHYTVLNTNAAMVSESDVAQNTRPTSSVFSVGTDSKVNADGGTYVCYLFAGGESTAATARSVDIDGTGDYFKFEAASSGIAVGTGNFTCEFWVKLNHDVSGNDALIDTRSSGSASDGFQIYLGSNRAVYGYVQGDMFGGTTKILNVGTWHHIAVVRPATNVIWLYVDGTRVGNQYGGDMTFSNSEMIVGANSAGGTEANCKISNLRLTKGQALYTSSFRPSTEPLTTTSQGATASNVKILAFNNSSVTGGTVVPTVTSNGNPTASTDSPFDDPAAFTFGESGSESIIKCGSYVGTSSTDGPEIYLGWEPQFILLKNSGGSAAWRIYDVMRGIVTGADDELIHPDNTSAGYTGGTNEIDLTSTGFKVVINDDGTNQSTKTYTYMAIRRPDGYVGKPAEAGTGVFTTVVGNSSSTIPAAVSGFPVDLAIYKTPASADSWVLSTRLTAGKYVSTDLNAAEGNLSDSVFDSNSGWYKGSYFNSNYQAYMWTRHAGFDVVTYKGNGVGGHQIPHSLSKSPEMIWVKDRDSTENWFVYHKGANGGSSPEDYALILNSSNAEWDFAGAWKDTAPTSTHLTLGTDSGVNGSNNDFIAMLFASVDGISKVGSYTGNGVKTGNVQTLGFQPRFILIKSAETATNWWVFDTTNGIAAGNENFLSLNTNNSTSAGDYIDLTSDGFDVVEDLSSINGNNKNYIYYAHA